MSKLQEMLAGYVQNSEVAIIWLGIFALIITVITASITKTILLFFPIPKKLKKLIRNVVVFFALGLAFLLWWLIVWPLV